MFVADLDGRGSTRRSCSRASSSGREQVRALMEHCEFVIVDRARSLGDDTSRPPRPACHRPERPRRDPGDPRQAAPNPNAGGADLRAAGRARFPHDSVTPTRARRRAPPRAASARGPATRPPPRYNSSEAPPYPGCSAASLGIKGCGARTRVRGARGAEGNAARVRARAALAPPASPSRPTGPGERRGGVPRAREVVAKSADLLEKLVHDIRLGQSFEVERVQEIVDDMVESIVRNPDALMWVARLREQDIATYGHGFRSRSTSPPSAATWFFPRSYFRCWRRSGSPRRGQDARPSRSSRSRAGCRVRNSRR